MKAGALHQLASIFQPRRLKPAFFAGTRTAGAKGAALWWVQRFIQNQYARISDQRAGNAYPLGLPTEKPVRVTAQEFLTQIDRCKDFTNSLGALSRSHTMKVRDILGLG